MKISQEGIDFIKSWEGLRLKPYRDAKGVWTVGYGHVLREVDTKRKITHEEAEAYLRKDLRNAERSANAVDNRLATLFQPQYDMIVSLIYNIGTGAFYRSKTRKELLEWCLPMMAVEWMGWNKITVSGQKKVLDGLLRRREAELRTFFTEEYHNNE